VPFVALKFILSAIVANEHSEAAFVALSLRGSSHRVCVIAQRIHHVNNVSGSQFEVRFGRMNNKKIRIVP
jgi:hypothetical protein